MIPIVLVTDPDGRIEAFSSLRNAVEENGLDGRDYAFYWSEGWTELHTDSARGMTLQELYLQAQQQYLRTLGTRWVKPNAQVMVEQDGDRWILRFTYLFF